MLLVLRVYNDVGYEQGRVSSDRTELVAVKSGEEAAWR